MYIDLQKHHISYLMPLIKARMEVLKKRVLKKYGSDWYDYDEQGIEDKVCEKDDEYWRLQQAIETIEKEYYSQNK